MQVSSQNNGSTRALNAQQRPPAANPTPARPAPAGTAGPSTVRRDRIDIGNAGNAGDVGGGSAAGMTPRERLDAYAQRFLDRLDHLMAKDGLSEEQLAALEEVKAELQRNVERFDDAFLEGRRSRDGIGPALKNLVATLRNSVQEALK